MTLAWLLAGQLSRLVLVIQRKDNGETIERWEFDVTLEDPVEDASPDKTSETKADESRPKPKTLIEIQNEIQRIVRQIIASVSFLPIFDFPR